MNAEQLAKYMQIGAKGAESGFEQQGQEKLAKLKAQLEQETSDKNIENLKNLITSGTLPEGSGASLTGTGGASITKGYNLLAQSNKEKQGDAQARMKANSSYMSGLPKISQALQAASEGLNAVNDPDNKMSKGQFLGAATRALGLSRFPNREEAAQLLPPSLQGQASHFLNWTGLESENPMNDADRKAANSFLGDVLKSQQEQHENLKQNSLNIYHSSPYSNPSGEQALANLGAPVDKQFTKLMQSHQSLPTTPGPNLTAGANPSPLDKLGGFFKKMAGFNPSPQAIKEPEINEVNHQDAITQELAKRAKQALNQPPQAPAQPGAQPPQPGQ